MKRHSTLATCMLLSSLYLISSKHNLQCLHTVCFARDKQRRRTRRLKCESHLPSAQSLGELGDNVGERKSEIEPGDLAQGDRRLTLQACKSEATESASKACQRKEEFVRTLLFSEYRLMTDNLNEEYSGYDGSTHVQTTMLII